VSLKRYSNYRDSGVAWLREIPAGWRSASLGSLTQIVNGGTPTPAEENWGGDVAWATPADMSAIDGHRIESTGRTLTETGLQTGSSRVPEGSVLLSTRAPIGYSVLADRPFAFNQGCKALVPGQFLSSVYLLHALQAAKAELSSRGQGTTFLELSTNALSAVRLPVPTMQEQTTIASFLDRETAEIGAFIADQEELIALLTERRAAIFAEHFDQVVRVADSVVRETTRPLGSVLAETDRRIGNRRADLLSVSIHRGVVGWSEMHDKPPRATDFSAYRQVDVDDIVLNRMRAFQGAAGRASQAGMVSPDYAVFKTKVGFAPKYVELLFRSRPFLEAIKLRLRGIGDESSGVIRTPRINVRDLVRIEVAMPSLDAQQQLVQSLGQESAVVDSAIADAREAIALSKERRAALISAAVTGKIDVRNHGGVE
jgi:type I restriction enzyme S subunit